MRREPAEVIDAARTLNVLNATGLNVIKKKFRKLAIEFHPDRSKHKNASARFKTYSEAYGVIAEYHKDGGRLPISNLVLRCSDRPRTHAGPAPKTASRTTVYVDHGQKIKAWIHESYTEGVGVGVGPNFWEALNSMFNPQAFRGIGQMMGGMGRVMGDLITGPLGTIHGRLRDVLGVVSTEKKFDAGTLRDIVEIISDGDESGQAAIGYIDGITDIREGIQRMSKAVKKKKKKKARRNRKNIPPMEKVVPEKPKTPEIPIPQAGRKRPNKPIGKFVVRPLALVRYKEASDDGKNPHLLWGELIAGDGSTQWGTFKVRMEGDIAIIDRYKYTVECKVS